MPEKKECPWCHGMKANIYEHRQVCKQRPADAGGLERKVASRKEKTATPSRAMRKRACAKGCGRMLDPRGAARHEAKCAGGSVVPAGRHAIPARLPAREALRGDLVMTIPALCERIRGKIGQYETAIQVLEGMRGEL